MTKFKPPESIFISNNLKQGFSTERLFPCDHEYQLMPRWIPVEDGLPKHEGRYLVHSKENGIDIRYRDGYGFKGCYFGIYDDEITHYRPLPAGPEEK